MKVEPMNELATQLGMLVGIALRADICKDVGITIEEVASLTHKKVYILNSIAFSYIDTQFTPIGLHDADRGICMFTAKTFPTMVKLANLTTALTNKLKESPEIDDFEADLVAANKIQAYYKAITRDVRDKVAELEQSLSEYHVCLLAMADMGMTNTTQLGIPTFPLREIHLGRNLAKQLLLLIREIKTTSSTLDLNADDPAVQ